MEDVLGTACKDAEWLEIEAPKLDAEKRNRMN